MIIVHYQLNWAVFEYQPVAEISKKSLWNNFDGCFKNEDGRKEEVAYFQCVVKFLQQTVNTDANSTRQELPERSATGHNNSHIRSGTFDSVPTCQECFFVREQHYTKTDDELSRNILEIKSPRQKKTVA